MTRGRDIGLLKVLRLIITIIGLIPSENPYLQRLGKVLWRLGVVGSFGCFLWPFTATCFAFGDFQVTNMNYDMNYINIDNMFE